MLARTPASTAENLRGGAYMVAGMFGFAVNDTISKFFGGELEVGQFMFLRGIIATTLVYPLAPALGQMRPLRLLAQPKILARTMGEAVATIRFITALFHIPIANVSAVMQALPLALTLCAAFFFGEKAGWRRLSAIAIGLAGVHVIIRSGMAGFSVGRRRNRRGDRRLHALSRAHRCPPPDRPASDPALNEPCTNP